MRNKGKKILIGYFVILIIFLSSLQSPALVLVKADSNYSNYLSSESISVEHDKALILYESSASSNNYRNYFETGFLFPSKLRADMYSTDLTTNAGKYYFQQTYLNNLDNDYAFSDVENLGQYETNHYVDNHLNIIENIGNYSSQTSNIYSDILIPDADLSNSWHYVSDDHYKAIQQDGNQPPAQLSDKLTAYAEIDENTNEIFRVSDSLSGLLTNDNFVLENITLWFKANRYNDASFITNDFEIYFTTDSFSTGWQTISTVENSMLWYSYSYETSDKSEIDSMTVGFNAPSNIEPFSAFYLKQVYISCNYRYNESLTLQESNEVSLDYITESSEILDDFNDGIRADFWTDDANSGSITEQNNRLEMYTIGTMDWYTGVYTNPKSYIEVDTSNDFEFSVDLLTDTPNNHFQGLCFFDDDANAWLFSQVTQSGVVKLWIRKIISGVATDITDLVINRNFLKIQKINSYWYFKYSDDDITYTSMYNTDSLGISVDNIGVYHSSYTGASAFTSFMDNFEMNGNILNISSQLKIETNGNSYDNLEQLELEYTVKSNTSSSLDLYMYNINSQIYDLVDSKVLTTDFQEFTYNFYLNYTYYSTLGFTNFTFYIQSSYNTLISFDKINLNSVFSNYSLNNNGYHNIDITFNRKTSTGTNRGNISLDLQLYKTYFQYNYIENNVIESDYSKMNQIVNFSNEVSEIREIEIQSHIRYGLNTLDIDIVNIYYEIIINYNYTFQLFEQLRFGNNDGNYFRFKLSYDSMNFNRLNNTGIFGNYSMNCLSGLRVLKGSTDINFNRYFLIPYFDEKISLSYTVVSGSESDTEPTLPSSHYWSYETFRLSEYGIIGITVGNWSVDFNTVYAESYQAKYPYNPNSLKRSSLGDWSFKILETKVSFNFLRNAITDIINLIFTFLQYLIFFAISSISFIFMYIGINILVLIWNYLVYYIFIAFLWIFWYLYSGLVWLFLWFWDMLIIIYETVLIPFFIWLEEVLFPIVLEWIIKFVAFGITCAIYFITLGQIDFDSTYLIVYDILWIIVNELLAFIEIFVKNLFYVFLFMLLYIYNLLILYFTFLYSRARGYKKKAEKLYYTLMFYLTPVLFILDMLKRLYGISPYP